MANNIRVAVIGSGHLGSIHARIYKNTPGCTLVGVCDIDPERAQRVAAELGVKAYTDYRKLLSGIDAASIATTTHTHFAVAREFLKAGIHLLVEKPFTTSLAHADTLIRLANKQKLILQVGHIERFNSAFQATQKIIQEPRFIECHRLSPFPNRSLDVGAVLDIMIHDIDIVLGLVPSPLKSVQAVGINVLTQFEDIANARITFQNGCVANLTASRVSDEVIRKIRIFQKESYISLDYKEASATVYRRHNASIAKELLPIEKEQPLDKELRSFLECIRDKKTPLVCGETARQALALALRIQKLIWKKKES